MQFLPRRCKVVPANNLFIVVAVDDDFTWAKQLKGEEKIHLTRNKKNRKQLNNENVAAAEVGPGEKLQNDPDDGGVERCARGTPLQPSNRQNFKN